MRVKKVMSNSKVVFRTGGYYLSRRRLLRGSNTHNVVKRTFIWLRLGLSWVSTIIDILQWQKANFATKLSTIGGTMGLLTGFSVISGVEFVYFVTRIIVGWMRSLMDKIKRLKQALRSLWNRITEKKDDPNRVVSLA